MATAPDLHEAFWVAIATAAPVIGLAAAVTAEQAARRGERTLSAGRPAPHFSPVTLTTIYANIVLQTSALAFALYSLGTHNDGTTSRVFAGSAIVLGMFLIFLPSYVSTLRNLLAG
jgi:hypothetical protein